MALREELLEQGNFLFKKRSFLPLLFLIAGICVQIYRAEFVAEAEESLISKTLEYASLAVGLLGLFIRVFTIGYTPKNTSGRNTNQGQVADELNTTGIYSLIRNPLYLGNYFMWIAIAMYTGSAELVIIFSLIFWIYYERIIFAEEAFLREKFGETYLRWTERTPVFLPTHFNYTKPKMSFSWKKVLKKEKNGLFALFLLFFIFETSKNSLRKDEFDVELGYLTIGAIVTGTLYFILKYLKKRTSVLDETGR